MAQQVKLKAQKRTLVGRNAIKKIKEKGLVPGVIYGSQAEPIALQVDGRELTNVLGSCLERACSGRARDRRRQREYQPTGSDSGSSASPLKTGIVTCRFSCRFGDGKDHFRSSDRGRRRSLGSQNVRWAARIFFAHPGSRVFSAGFAGHRSDRRDESEHRRIAACPRHSRFLQGLRPLRTKT